MVKYVMVDEVRDEVVLPILSEDGEELYASGALKIMKEHPFYDKNKHFLYLRVGHQGDED